MKKLIIVLLLSSVIVRSSAQQFEWDLGFRSFVDNREYANSGRNSETIIGLRLAPEVGFVLNEAHRIRIGFSALHEFGSEKFGKQVIPTIYYDYRKNGFDFYIGMFPREDLLKGFPNAFLNDTLQYFRPNLSGMLLNYRTSVFKQQLWIDWTSKQTESTREQFLAGVSGTVNIGQFYSSHDIILWHNSLPKNAASDVHIRDNLAAILRLGMDISSPPLVDSLTFSVGGMISFDRMRGVYDWRSPKGTLLEAYAGYKSFFVQDVFYMGEAQYIGIGDSFYASERYNRLDLGWTPFRYKRIEGKLVVSLHFTPGAFDNQQAFKLRYNIGGNYKTRSSYHID